MIDSPEYRIEACVESLGEARRAIINGADQIELCSALSLDGLTPTVDQVRQCLSSIKHPIKVMIRPKAGDFQVSPRTLERMKEEIKMMKELGVLHFVFGITTVNSQLDIEKIKELIAEIHPFDVTIHKAIDTCIDPVNEVRRLREVGGVTQILTSGGADTAINGASVIRSMIREAGDEIKIIAAGSITAENLKKVHELIQAPIYHGRRIVGQLS